MRFLSSTLSKSGQQSMNAMWVVVRFAAAFALVASWPAIARELDSAELTVLRETTHHASPSPTPAALELARKIGREGNLDGLRAVIELRQPLLLRAGIDSLALKDRMLPEPVEAMIIEQYANPDARRALIGLIGRTYDFNRSERVPLYRSRRLFDLMYGDLSLPNADDQFLAYRIVTTDQSGIEVPLVALLPKLSLLAANEVVPVLGRRRYAPAVSALRALQGGIPFARDVNGLLGNIDEALLEIGTPSSTQAVLDRLQALAKQYIEPRAVSETVTVLNKVARLRAGDPPTYQALRAALPRDIPPSVQQALVKVIVARKQKQGVRDLNLALAQGNEDALNGLLAIGEPDDWRAGKVLLQQAAIAGTLKPERVAAMTGRLDGALADLPRFLAERAETERKQAFVAARAALVRQQDASSSLIDTDLRRYVAEMEGHLRNAEELLSANAGLGEAANYRRDIKQKYSQLAGYTRFGLSDGAHAVELYEKAVALGLASDRQDDVLWERIGMADTLRFDLRNPNRALPIYKLLLSQLSANDNQDEGGIRRPLIQWLRVEIDFLAEGKRYRGTPDRETIGGVAAVMYFGEFGSNDPSLAPIAKTLSARDVRESEKADFADRLDALSPSQARLLETLNFMPLLGSPERIAAFVNKHDPAGFLAANIFALQHVFVSKVGDRPARNEPGMSVFRWSPDEWALMGKAEALALGRHVIVDLTPDPNLASPESTWKTFIDAMRRGDLDAAWKCTTPQIRDKFEHGFQAMTSTQLKEAADSTMNLKRGAEFGDFVEGMVVRPNGQAGVVTFIRQGAEWRITEM